MVRNNLILMCLLGFMTIGRSMGDIPKQIGIQGQVTDTTGIVLSDGNYDVTFSVYSVDNGDAPIYTEIASQLLISNGRFSYLLGSSNVLNLPFGRDYWLSVKIGDDDELLPRSKIVSVGNSYKSLNADYADSANQSNDSLSSLTTQYLISAENILTGVIAADRLVGNYSSITANHAISSDYAFSSDSANVSLSASNATNAVNAESAENATYAIQAGSSYQADTAVTLVSASNILEGVISTERIIGNYLNATTQYALVAGSVENATTAQEAIYAFTASTATTLVSAANILDGILSAERLQGMYGRVTVDHSFTSVTAQLLLDAESIINGVVQTERISGNYLNATTNHALSADNALVANQSYSSITSEILGSAANIISGTILSDRMNGFYSNVTSNHALTSETSFNAINSISSLTTQYLLSASDILSGIISPDRLEGTYLSLTSGYSLSVDSSIYAEKSNYSSSADVATTIMDPKNQTG